MEYAEIELDETLELASPFGYTAEIERVGVQVVHNNLMLCLKGEHVATLLPVREDTINMVRAAFDDPDDPERNSNKEDTFLYAIEQARSEC